MIFQVIPKIPIQNETAKQLLQKSVGPASCGLSAMGLESILESGSEVGSFASLSGTQNQSNMLTNFAVGKIYLKFF